MAAELLGGKRVIRQAPLTHLAAHELILSGLPTKALHHLIGNFAVLTAEVVVPAALGISLRTYQRLESAGTRALGHELGGRAWKFAELLAQATSILGSKQEAEQWFMQAATGLDGRRPIDLLATPAGVELVEDFLQRLEYGVYV